MKIGIVIPCTLYGVPAAFAFIDRVKATAVLHPPTINKLSAPVAFSAYLCELIRADFAPTSLRRTRPELALTGFEPARQPCEPCSTLELQSHNLNEHEQIFP